MYYHAFAWPEFYVLLSSVILIILFMDTVAFEAREIFCFHFVCVRACERESWRGIAEHVIQCLNPKGYTSDLQPIGSQI